MKIHTSQEPKPATHNNNPHHPNTKKPPPGKPKNDPPPTTNPALEIASKDFDSPQSEIIEDVRDSEFAATVRGFRGIAGRECGWDGWTGVCWVNSGDYEFEACEYGEEGEGRGGEEGFGEDGRKGQGEGGV